MTERPPLVVVALGGNAIQDPDGDDSVASDFEKTRSTAGHLVQLALRGPCRVVVTHGNGPQVGNHMLRSELAADAGHLPELPLDVCVADTQGGMGYMLQQCIADAFHEQDVPALVVTLVTQTIVDRDDDAFREPSKPVGHVIHDASKADALREAGWDLVEDKHRDGWRRVVPSPDPKEIVEAAAIRSLVEDGVVVIAAGGGGIPVLQEADGSLTGVAAVVDKDLASALLAADLRAETLLILTDVNKVKTGFDTENEAEIDELTVAEARALASEGEFPAGSMGPKVEAACRFAERTGNPAIIGAIADIVHGLDTGFGTRIVP